MSESAMWIIPEAPPPDGLNLTSGRKMQGGVRLGVLDNSKSNADHLLAMIVDGIKAQLPVISVTTLRKPGPAAGADPKIIEQLAEEADCVISAMAD
jgi:uncharacterized protein YhfF